MEVVKQSMSIPSSPDSDYWFGKVPNIISTVYTFDIKTCHMFSVQTPWLFVLAKFIVCNVRPSTLNCKDKKISSLDMGGPRGYFPVSLKL